MVMEITYGLYWIDGNTVFTETLWRRFVRRGEGCLMMHELGVFCFFVHFFEVMICIFHGDGARSLGNWFRD